MSLSARYCGGNGAGSYNKPGLPNIKGRFDVALNQLNDPVSYLGQTSAGTGEWGAFYVEAGATGGPLGSLTTTTLKTAKRFLFDASGPSVIYGASAMVMPASVETPVALYMGRAAQI